MTKRFLRRECPRHLCIFLNNMIEIKEDYELASLGWKYMDKNLESIPEEIRNLPKEYPYNLYLNKNYFKTLEGLPKVIGGHLDIGNFKGKDFQDIPFCSRLWIKHPLKGLQRTCWLIFSENLFREYRAAGLSNTEFDNPLNPLIFPFPIVFAAVPISEGTK